MYLDRDQRRQTHALVGKILAVLITILSSYADRRDLAGLHRNHRFGNFSAVDDGSKAVGAGPERPGEAALRVCQDRDFRHRSRGSVEGCGADHRAGDGHVPGSDETTYDAFSDQAGCAPAGAAPHRLVRTARRSVRRGARDHQRQHNGAEEARPHRCRGRPDLAASA